MFSRASSVFVLALPIFVAASVLRRGGDGGGGSSQCNTGSTQCCDSAVDPSDPSIAVLLGSLGIDIGSLTGLVGVTCSPITIIGAGSSPACDAQPVCCTNNNFNGIVALDCNTISL